MNPREMREKYEPMTGGVIMNPALTLVELQQLRHEIHKDLLAADGWSNKDEESNKLYRELEKQLEDVTGAIRRRELGESDEAARARGQYERADRSHLIRSNESFEKTLQSRGMIHQPEFEKLSTLARLSTSFARQPFAFVPARRRCR